MSKVLKFAAASYKMRGEQGELISVTLQNYMPQQPETGGTFKCETFPFLCQLTIQKDLGDCITLLRREMR